MDTLTTTSQEHVELSRRLADQGVSYAVGAWIDVLGRAKSKVVPIGHLPALTLRQRPRQQALVLEASQDAAQITGIEVQAGRQFDPRVVEAALATPAERWTELLNPG